MGTTWAEVVLSAGSSLLAGRSPWERRRRSQHHARVAVRRLRRGALADLARLEERSRALLDVQRPLGATGDHATDARLGPDRIGDFHRLIMAELKVWADEAAQEMEGLPGHELEGRRAALRRLRAEIQDLCAEIAERQAMWSEIAHLLGREGAPPADSEPGLR